MRIIPKLFSQRCDKVDTNLCDEGDPPIERGGVPSYETKHLQMKNKNLFIDVVWHTSGKEIHKIKVCGNVLASFLKFDTFWQCYGNLPLVAKLFAITLPLAAKIGTVLWHRIPLPQSCCNLVATLRQRIFFIREVFLPVRNGLAKLT